MHFQHGHILFMDLDKDYRVMWKYQRAIGQAEGPNELRTHLPFWEIGGFGPLSSYLSWVKAMT